MEGWCTVAELTLRPKAWGRTWTCTCGLQSSPHHRPPNITPWDPWGLAQNA